MPAIPLPSARRFRVRWLHLSTAWLLPGLIALAAILLQCLTALDNDVSWLLTVADHMLDGQRLYVDIVETNPPASVLIYLPGAILARALGLSDELVVATLVFALGALSIAGAGRLLLRGGLLPPAQRRPLLCAALFTLLLLPAACFAEREHVALLTLLPMIAVAMLRAEDRPVPPGAALIAGLGAGATMAIKPHFLLAILPLTLLVLARRRSCRVLVAPENLAAAALVLAYVAVVMLAFPAFVRDMLPLLRDTYLPARLPAVKLWFSAAILLQLTSSVLAMWLAGRQILSSRAVWPLAAATGFGAALIIQGKGYLNHGYPGDALALLALAITLIEPHGDRGKRRFAGAALLGLSGISLWYYSDIFEYKGLPALVERVAPPHPRIIVAGDDLAVGHPLTRWVHGTWVGHSHSLWLSGNVSGLLQTLPPSTPPAKRAHLRALADAERRQFVADVAERHANVVLVEDRDSLNWIRSHPDVRAVLADFHPAGMAAGVAVWVRGPSRPPSTP